MKTIFKIFLFVVIFSVNNILTIKAQPSPDVYILNLISGQRLLTIEEIESYCQNANILVDFYDPYKKEKTLKILKMTEDRFKYVDLKINAYAMMHRGLEDHQGINDLAKPTSGELQLLDLKKEEVIKVNNDFIKLLTFGLKE